MNNTIQYHYSEVGEALVEKLHLHVQRGESFVLLGYQGAGKRQAVQRLAYRLKEEERPYLAVWFQDFSSIITENELLAVCKERCYPFLCEHIVDNLSGATSMVDWFHRLGTLSNGRTFPLCFANIDCLAGPIKELLLALIRDAVQNKHIVVCLTGESILARTLGEKTSPWQCAYQYVLVGHDRSTARDFFLKRVDACGISFRDPRDSTWTTEAAFHAFYDHTGGNLNLLRAILWCLSERRLRFDEDPETHDGYPRSIVEQSFLNYTAVPLFGLKIFHPVVTFIQQDREALTRIEDLLDQVHNALDIGASLQTACLEASIPVSDGKPEFLELAGFLRRNVEGERAFFSSFYVAEYVVSYFSLTCRGDFHAKQGDWEKAFARYGRVEELERRVRPLGEHDFQNVRAIVNRLCREFAELITDDNAVTKIRRLWEQCGELLFGLKAAVVLHLNEGATWVTEADDVGEIDRFDALVKELLASSPLSGSRKLSDEPYYRYFDSSRRVMLLRNRPGTPELKPSYVALLVSEPTGPIIEGLRENLLITAITTFLTCFNEARVRQRLRGSRLRLGEAMQRLFEHTSARESLEALGLYLHREFLATGVRLFLLQSGNLHSAKSWGFKDPKRQLDFDSEGV
jgi:energy-coupling factor transporter ATP-binding protein EcfA2